ncbi:uncharacterized protein LY89DRAFT_737969 [Mollisia scopiformis]|uniref:Uncharacterized protein n=1 Tax=Mollisia scopiformis TaxID=149040 RepID=A0A194WYN8_MOLSC|nr:uncharacterized protein LY89DRAFT_737969 [Mollisia scopiformis]KUJ13073.1 hypothetical protein LY89DRAFT_737969 [Mollisia scopiformis]
MATSKSYLKISNEVDTLKPQLLSSFNDLNKIDFNSLDAEINSHSDGLLMKHNESLAKEKKANTKSIDCEALGSDAESDDDEALEKAVETAEKLWQSKLAARKEKKLVELFKEAFKKERESVKSFMDVASQILAALDTGIGDCQVDVDISAVDLPTAMPDTNKSSGVSGSEDKVASCVTVQIEVSSDTAVGITAVTPLALTPEDKDTRDDQVEDTNGNITASPVLVELSKQSGAIRIVHHDEAAVQQLASAIADAKKHNLRAEKLENDLTNFKSKVKAAFEEVVSTSVAHKEAVMESKEVLLAKKLKDRYIAEQVMTIPEVLAILPTRDDHGGKGGVVIREILKLHRRMKELDHEYKTLKDKNLDLDALSAALEAVKKENTTAKTAVAKLKRELEEKDPLFQVGVAVRRGFLEAVKRTWVNGDMRVVRGDPDKYLIIAKNDAVHRGNYLADRDLWVGGYLKTKEELADFEYVYHVALNPKGIPFPKFISLYNMWGSMVACYFKTAYTHDKSKDEAFERAYLEIRALWTKYSKGVEAKEAHEKLSACALAAGKFHRMNSILEDTAHKERNRLRPGSN